MKSLIYKNSMKAFGLLVSLLICSCSFVSCDDDDDNEHNRDLSGRREVECS